MRIALDAMAGDFGLDPLVRGAIRAVREGRDEVVLVGDAPKLEAILNREHALHPRLSIVHADSVVAMDEAPALSLKKKNSSLAVAAELVKSGDAHALVSAGNTGATHACVMMRWRRLAGVSRPTLATVIPVPDHPVVLLDVGANIDCRPQHLADFAVMGAIYCREMFGRRTPRVGLLNIGSEEGKGHSVIQMTYNLLAESGINFVGNVEGGDMFTGQIDVVVCDGFVGNSLLKFGEGLIKMVGGQLKKELSGGPLSRLGALLMLPALRRFRNLVNPSEYGGAPLLGVNGICLVCHGASDAYAIKQALLMAGDCVRRDLNGKIMEALQEEHLKAASRRDGAETDSDSGATAGLTDNTARKDL
jgi:glycerol-3-phosphate acyltransferase PlsX